MLATVTSKGRVTIPKEIRDRLRIGAHDTVEFVFEGERVLLIPVKTLSGLRGAVEGGRGKGFAEERTRAKAAVAERVIGEME